ALSLVERCPRASPMREDRPRGGIDPPGVAYMYAPDRKAEQPLRHLQGFVGMLQVDGYAGYRALAGRNAPGAMSVAAPRTGAVWTRADSHGGAPAHRGTGQDR